MTIVCEVRSIVYGSLNVLSVGPGGVGAKESPTTTTREEYSGAEATIPTDQPFATLGRLESRIGCDPVVVPGIVTYPEESLLPPQPKMEKRTGKRAIQRLDTGATLPRRLRKNTGSETLSRALPSIFTLYRAGSTS